MSNALVRRGTDRDGVSTERGVGWAGRAAVGILLLYQRLHGPLIVCLSFRPGEHVMSPLDRVCFFFLSASWQQGALTHLIWPCTAVWCQADCPAFVCACACLRVCVCKGAQWISCLLATHFFEVNVNANRVRTVLIPLKDYCYSLKTSDFIDYPKRYNFGYKFKSCVICVLLT